MKYPLTPKDKAAIYSLFKRLQQELKLSRHARRSMKSLSLKFTPGDKPVDLRPQERLKVLNILYPLYRVMMVHGKDEDLAHQVRRVIEILDRGERKPTTCSSTSTTPTSEMETTRDE